MTKDEKLAFAVEFAQRVIDDAWSDVVTEVSASDILNWAQDCGLICTKEVRGVEAAEYGVPAGSRLYVYEEWVEKVANL